MEWPLSDYLQFVDWALWLSTLAVQCVLLYLLRRTPYKAFRRFLGWLTIQDVMLVTAACLLSAETYAVLYYLGAILQSWLLVRCMAEIFHRVFWPRETLPFGSLPVMLFAMTMIPAAAVALGYGLVPKTGISTGGLFRAGEIGIELATFLGFVLLLTFAEFFGIRPRSQVQAISLGFSFILGLHLVCGAVGLSSSPAVNLWLRRLESVSVLIGYMVWLFHFPNKSSLPPKLSTESAGKVLAITRRLSA